MNPPNQLLHTLLYSAKSHLFRIHSLLLLLSGLFFCSILLLERFQEQFSWHGHLDWRPHLQAHFLVLNSYTIHAMGPHVSENFYNLLDLYGFHNTFHCGPYNNSSPSHCENLQHTNFYHFCNGACSSLRAHTGTSLRCFVADDLTCQSFQLFAKLPRQVIG